MPVLTAAATCVLTQGGVHNPMAELLYYQFCEALVRLAALRYRHLPGLEKRLHTLIHVHLIHQVRLTCQAHSACQVPGLQGTARAPGGPC